MEGGNDIWKPEQFQLGSKTTFYQGLELVDVMMKLKLKRTEIILDAGCGSGEITKLLSKVFTNKSIYGFDKQPSMIKFAKENHNSEIIRYVCGDISAPWEELHKTIRDLDGEVDIVFSNYILHVVNDKKAAFENIARLLRSGGYFFLNVPLIPDLNDHFEFCEEEKQQNLKYINSRTKEEQIQDYNNMITESGLVILDLKEFLAEWRYDSKEDLNAFLEIIPKILATKMLKDGINDMEKRDLIKHYSSLYIKAITNKNFQNLPGVNIDEDFDLHSFCFTRLRYICKTID